MRRQIAFVSGGKRQDNFFNFFTSVFFALYPIYQFRHFQVFGDGRIQRGKQTAQNMIESFVISRFFDSRQISFFFSNANHFMISGGVVAEMTFIFPVPRMFHGKKTNRTNIYIMLQSFQRLF